jgi:hypothetical protein
MKPSSRLSATRRRSETGEHSKTKRKRKCKDVSARAQLMPSKEVTREQAAQFIIGVGTVIKDYPVEWVIDALIPILAGLIATSADPEARLKQVITHLGDSVAGSVERLPEAIDWLNKAKVTMRSEQRANKGLRRRH